MKDKILLVLLIIGVVLLALVWFYLGYTTGANKACVEEEYHLQYNKMLVKETGRIYYKVMIYERGERPIYAECDTLEQVEELKDFYNAKGWEDE